MHRSGQCVPVSCIKVKPDLAARTTPILPVRDPHCSQQVNRAYRGSFLGLLSIASWVRPLPWLGGKVCLSCAALFWRSIHPTSTSTLPFFCSILLLLCSRKLLYRQQEPLLVPDSLGCTALSDACQESSASPFNFSEPNQTLPN